MVAARKLHRRTHRAATGRFLVEGPQAVGAAVGQVRELFVTAEAAARYPEVVDAVAAGGAQVSPVTERAAAVLSETVTPQGMVAVCATVDVPVATALGTGTRLVAVLAGVADPGNAGTVIRVADAAGADAVVLAGNTVDPHNGKCVRASAGSLFHLPVAVEPDPLAALAACRAAGLRLLAATAGAPDDLDAMDTAGTLCEPTAWVFGSEAHGLPADLLATVDQVVAIPIYGRAESLNLATAAAVCLYTSARQLRRQ